MEKGAERKPANDALATDYKVMHGAIVIFRTVASENQVQYPRWQKEPNEIKRILGLMKKI